MNGVIYKITSPSGKVYIGQSKNFVSRFSNYKNLKCKDQFAIYNSLLKYGWDKHSFEVIYECPSELLNYAEDVFIRKYNSLSNGLNCKSGGDVIVYSEETKKRMSLLKTGKKMPQEWVEIMKQRMKGNTFRRGKPNSLETRLKISKNSKGKEYANKTVVCFDNEGFYKEFESLTKAALFFTGEKKVSTITESIKYNRKTHGYYWKYKNK